MPKMDYFGSKFPKLLSAGGSAPRPAFRLNDQRMCKTLPLLKILV